MKITLSILLVGTMALAQPLPKSNLLEGINNIPPSARLLLTELANDHVSFQGDEVLKLAKIDGVTPPLMELLKKIYSSPPTDENLEFNIFFIFRNSHGLTESELAWFRERLNEQWGKPHDTFIAAFKQESLWLLGLYPSPANEETLIKHLQEDKAVGFAYAAVDSLALIGTSKAVPALEQYKATLDSRFDNSKITAQAITSINERERLKDRAPNDQTSSKQPPAPLKSPVHPQTATPDAAHEPTSQGWLVWLLVVIAAIGLLWLFLKKRK